MSEPAQKTADRQQTPGLPYYYDVKWRLRAEAPWLAITLILAVSMAFRIIVSKDQLTPETVPDIVANIVILGVLVIPMIIMVASGDADLSMGSLAGLVFQLTDFLRWQTNLEVAILISLLAALTVGLINGLLVSSGRLKGYILTFGMSYVLYGLIIKLDTFMGVVVPPWLAAVSRSPLTLCLWVLLVIVCAALMVFMPRGCHPRDGEPGRLYRRGPFYKGSLFVFSSFMAWVSGMLLLSWARDTGIGVGSGYTEIALLATLMGGTAYGAGTGFVLSGATALVAIVLFRTANQRLDISAAQERVILGMLIVIMLPIVQYYHAGIDRLYRRQREKARDASSRDGSQP